MRYSPFRWSELPLSRQICVSLAVAFAIASSLCFLLSVDHFGSWSGWSCAVLAATLLGLALFASEATLKRADVLLSLWPF